MGNFEDHLQYGLLSLVITLSLTLGFAYLFIWPYQLALAFLPIAFGATIFGSLLPDIDHHNSRPYKTIQYVLPLSAGAISLASFWFYFTPLVTIVQQPTGVTEEVVAFGGFITSVIVTLLVRETISYLRPPHRGITHTISFTVGVAVLTSGIAFFLLQATDLTQSIIQSGSVVIGLAIAIGILSHLYCDNILFK